MAIDTVQKRLRERPVTEQVAEIKELLNREHGPLITELRTRFNELLGALNPDGEVTATAGALIGYAPMIINGVEVSVPVYARS